MEGGGGPHCRGMSGNLEGVEGEFVCSWTFQLTGDSQIDQKDPIRDPLLGSKIDKKALR